MTTYRFASIQSPIELIGLARSTVMSAGKLCGIASTAAPTTTIAAASQVPITSIRRRICDTASSPRWRRSLTLLALAVSRSRTIARSTIATPASKVWPRLSLIRAWMIDSPRPGALIRAVITTIDRAIMIVWFTARPIVLRAIGSCTLRRTWNPVEPSDSAASTASDETPRIPRAVIRMAGGRA